MFDVYDVNACGSNVEKVAVGIVDGRGVASRRDRAPTATVAWTPPTLFSPAPPLVPWRCTHPFITPTILSIPSFVVYLLLLSPATSEVVVVVLNVAYDVRVTCKMRDVVAWSFTVVRIAKVFVLCVCCEYMGRGCVSHMSGEGVFYAIEE
jgi:hypothetical protein